MGQKNSTQSKIHEGTNSRSRSPTPNSSQTSTKSNPAQIPNPPNSFDSFTSVSWEPLHQKLYESVFNLILQKALFFNTEEAKKLSPYKFKTPEELEILMDFKLGIDGVDHETLIGLLEKVIRYSPHHSHPYYLDKFSAGLDPYAIAGDMLGTVLSSPAITYFFGPVFTLMEEEVKKRIRELIGYEGGRGDGIICPGNGFASLMALRLALHKSYPELKGKGYFGIGSPKVCIFISEHATKAFHKAAFIAGIGEEACISIKTDSNGRMSVDDLINEYVKAKANGYIPLMVVATAGTASLGAIDPIDKISNFCKANKLWLHVDADYAGGYLLSDKLKENRLKGIERTDSVNWSPTGMIGSSYCNNYVVTRHEKLFQEAFGMGAQYVFAKTDLYDPSWDNGDRTLQTTRRVDIMRLWLMWKAKGKSGLAKHVEYTDNLSKDFVQELRKRESAFQLILNEYDSTKISFYYIPNSLRGLDRKKDNTNATIKSFASKLKAQLLLKGSMQIGISTLPNQPDFFTISVSNSGLNHEDIIYILDKIESCGEELMTDSKVKSESAIQANRPIPSSKTHEDFISAPIPELHKSFFEKFFKLLSDKTLYFQHKRHETPYNFRKPEVLLQEFDFELRNEPGIQNDEDLLKTMEQIIFYSTRQAHPYFVVQLLSAGLDPYSIMAEFVLATMPSAMQTYEQAPVYTLMEKEVLRMVRERIGFPNGDGDGTLCPGGSISVITAIYAAISSRYPNSRALGMTEGVGKKLVIYLSKNGHVCFKKGSLLQGIGIENCVMVNADENGKMNVSELRKAIGKTMSEGGVPLLVGATSSTTVIGTFDPLDEIADVCKEYNLWLHSDGSLGGSVLMSDSKKEIYLKGIERVDSMNFNTHKLFGVPLEGSILVFKQKGILKKVFGTEDPNNFPTTANLYSPKWDMNGSGGIQMDRRANILKFWFLWKAKGINGMGKHVDYAYDIKDYAVSQLKARNESFQIWKPDFEFPCVCFYYVPKKLRGLDRNSVEFKTRINDVANQLRNIILSKTSVVIGTMSDGDSPMLLKMVLMSSGLIQKDIDYMLDQIEFYGEDLDA